MYNKKSVYEILRMLCKKLKYSAGGDFWFEPSEKLIYKIFHFVMFTMFYTMFALECLEVILNDYPTDLHNDAVSFVMGHMTVIIRVRLMIYRKEEARRLAKDVVKACKEHEEEELEAMLHHKVKYTVFFQFFMICNSMNFFTAEGFRRVYADGMPFVAVVTYLPRYEDNSNLALAIRISILIIHYYFLWNMLSYDALAIGYLIIISFKFITLRKYFNSLSEEYENKSKEISENIKENSLGMGFKKRFAEGLKMHRELIRLAHLIRDIYGGVISIQVLEGTFVTIKIMMNIALTSDLTFTMVMMNLLYATCLLYTVALYTLNGGEVTYQASLIHTSIFHCGWYKHLMMTPAHDDVRRLVLMGCIQAQKPVIIKVFGLHTLSYETFVGVLKTSYSIFALLRRR